MIYRGGRRGSTAQSFRMTTSDMVFSVAQLISILSEVMTLSPGDIIVSGTPAGVYDTGSDSKNDIQTDQHEVNLCSPAA
jgi:2-keto-4-pentenoate hydratase/2-oxohepta-3-ene-1,7-dioic acid hydratase in catechol pathway